MLVEGADLGGSIHKWQLKCGRDKAGKVSKRRMELRD
jgi:hypothetical protein